MPTRYVLLLSVLIGFVAFAGRPEAQGPSAAFHAVGDLPGGAAFTVVNDATRVGGTIYAIGGAVMRPATCPLPCALPTRVDTPIVWQFDGTSATLTALPDIIVNTTSIRGAANDVTPDGRYIASQAAGNGNWAVRVDRTLLPSTAANLNIQTVVSPPLTAAMLPADAISADGTIVYARTVASPSRAYRFDLSAGTAAVIPTLGSDTQSSVAPAGTSADGNVVVGDSFSPGPRRAYRYQHGLGAAAIPLLPGGTSNRAIALSPDGDLVLVSSDSAGNPNPQPYLYKASTGDVVLLGSPNTPWRVGGRICANGLCNAATIAGRMTADGSVVALNFFQPLGDSYAYFRNAHGWFHLASALQAAGVDLEGNGWSHLVISGISADGTLVFGAGEHNGTVDGFVADFAPSYLKNFNPQAAPPTDTSLVGVWSEDAVGEEDHFLVFMAGGSYYQIEDGDGGFERGIYTFDGNALTITTLVDTNGSGGLSDLNGTSSPITVSGDTAGDGALHRITGGAGSIVGAWVGGNPAERDSSNVVVFSANTYGTAQDFADDDDGSETGSYTWDAVSHELNVFPAAGPPDVGNVVTPSPDGRGLHVVDDGGGEEFDFVRVIDPATIPVITSPLTASGVSGQAFSYAVTATNAVSFGATGLPDGLAINSSTGIITGAPAAGGQFAVTITATNSSGVSDIETLIVTIAMPTPVGQNVVVEPVVPEGQGPVTLSFSEVTAGGTTTVTVVDPTTVPAPGNVSVAGVIYEVTTTATFEGLVTLCFSYDGIDFGAATPRLFHYENDVWVDITTSVDPATKTICGATTTLSPFAVLVSNVVRTGFYAPVNPIAGFLNTVNGGSTVPLKFNVSVNGVNQTTTEGLALTLQMVNCDSNAPEDPVELVAVTGGTTLRYEGGRFIYNWKVPKAAGCYMIRMATEQDGLALTARFKVK